MTRLWKLIRLRFAQWRHRRSELRHEQVAAEMRQAQMDEILRKRGKGKP